MLRGPRTVHRGPVTTDSLLSQHLPELYRRALDAADDLARHGQRAEAARLRHAAGRAYSRAWDESCRRTLEDVIRRAGAASAVRDGTVDGVAAATTR